MVQPKKEMAFIICKTNAPILRIAIIKVKNSNTYKDYDWITVHTYHSDYQIIHLFHNML